MDVTTTSGGSVEFFQFNANFPKEKKQWVDAMKNRQELIVTCDCHDPEHRIEFSYFKGDDDWDTLDITIHLTTYQNIFRRLWTAIRFVFGYKSRYGEWDSLVVNPIEARKMAEFLLSYADEYEVI